MKKTTHRNIASLHLPRQVGLLLAIARAIAQTMDGNKSFPNPDPTIATLNTAITDLANAETAVKAQSRSKSAVTARDQKRAELLTLLEQSKAYVQKMADADPAHGAEIIQSAGMNVRKVPVRTKRVFGVKPGPLSGSVALATGSAGQRASYDWSYSADGGKTWQMASPTLQAKTVVTGLQPGVNYEFRYRAVTKSGAAEWSQSLTMMVK
jgi:hypothetical protein